MCWFPNFQVYDVPESNQITVQSGDFIGLHYVSSTPSPIIACIRQDITDADPIEYGLTMSELSNFRSKSINDANMPVGFELSAFIKSDKIKLCALRAYVSPILV